jgi:hypothetical protein
MGAAENDCIMPFGYITGLANLLARRSGGGARQIQFGAKLTF